MIIDMTNIFANKSVLTGRSALAYRNFGVSADPRVITEVANIDHEIYVEPRWILPRDIDFEEDTYNNHKIASINQAIFDCIKYDYDDSNIEELLDCMSNEDILSFRNWLNSHNKYNEIKDKLILYGFE